MEGLTILQWNARSLYSNGTALKHYLDNHPKPDVICIQETFFYDKKYIKLNGYHPPILKSRKSVTKKDKKKPGKGGGVAIYIVSSLSLTEINFDSDIIETVGVTINCQNKNITIVNSYRPPNNKVQAQDYKIITDKLTENSVLLGDLNSKSPLWGSPASDFNGKILENVIEEKNLIILNDGTGTHRTNTGNPSHIDLTIVTPSLANNSSWEVLNDPLGSDHFPILTTLNAKPIKTKVITPQRWIFEKADWLKYKTLCDNIDETDVENDDINIFNQNLCEIITKIAEVTIPKTSGKIHERKNCPLWNEECTRSKRIKRQTQQKFDRSKNPSDLEAHKTAVKAFKTTTDKARKEYWQKFCSTLNHRSNLKTVWNTIRGMKGAKFSNIPTLGKDNPSVNNKDKANLLGQTFADASNDTNLDPIFKTHKDAFELANSDIMDKHKLTMIKTIRK